MQQKEAAEGLLEYVMNRNNGDIQVQVRWYEKLHNWDKALALYNERLDAVSGNIDEDAILGQMRCLEALGEWDDLYAATEQRWSSLSDDNQRRAGRLAAASAWGLNQWDAMERLVLCFYLYLLDYTVYFKYN